MHKVSFGVALNMWRGKHNVYARPKASNAAWEIISGDKPPVLFSWDHEFAIKAELKIGDRIRFDNEKRFRWTVRAVSHPFVICTTSGHYTILNLDKNVRGPDNCYGVGYATEADILRAIGRLVLGDLEISRRNSVPLVIKEIK